MDMRIPTVRIVRWTAGMLLSLGPLFGCNVDDRGPSTDSESHWLDCRSSEDCPGDQRCVDNVCTAACEPSEPDCGVASGDDSKALQSSAEPMGAPEEPPAGAESFEVTADAFELGASEQDRYQCFVVDSPVGSERFVRRLEPIVDRDRILRHAILSVARDGTFERSAFECAGLPPGDAMVYGWTSSHGPIEFDRGGVAFDSSTQFILQVHYAKEEAAGSVRDSSGVRLFHTASAPRELELTARGPSSFVIPPHSPGDARSECLVEKETRIVASFPQMRRLGTEFHAWIVREGGDRERLLDLTGWTPEGQRFYRTAKTLYPGDRLVTECVWYNPGDSLVTYGLGAGSEMCTNFMYVTPPNPDFCR